MNAFLFIVALVPHQVLIATPRGQASIPVTSERGAAAVAAVLLSTPLGLALSLDGSTIRATLAGSAFEFDLGSPFVRYAGTAYPMVGAPYVARDTVFLPLHWLSDYVPHLLASRYHWDPWLARLDELSATSATPAAASPAAATSVASPSAYRGRRSGSRRRRPWQPGHAFSPRCR